jgi:hypothetical protein
MTSDDTTPGPLELLDSARTKYQLAVARLRRGPAELALLSLHGAIEDVVRAHGMRLELPEAAGSFPQLLDALTGVRQQPLSAAEAEGVRRMHRLRARVAHGEQIVVTRETLDAYQRLAARLLPRYGVMVVAPEGGAEPEPTTREPGAPPRREWEPTPAAVRRGETARLERAQGAAQPRRERTTVPDDNAARYMTRARPSRATADLPLAREWAGSGRVREVEQRAEWLARAQGWLMPVLAVLTIFLIGAVISVGLQQMRAEPLVPTAAVPTVAASAFAPQITTTEPGTSAAESTISGEGGATGPTAFATAATAAPTASADGLAPGRTAYVRADAPGLNVRAQAGATSQIIFSLGPGSEVEIIGGPVEADGFTWWQVRGPTAAGWCAGAFLETR